MKINEMINMYTIMYIQTDEDNYPEYANFIRCSISIAYNSLHYCNTDFFHTQLIMINN